MTKLEELNARIKTMVEILCTAKESMKIVAYLLEYKSEQEKCMKKQNYFMVWTLFINWRIVVLELTKLISNGANHKHSLKKIFDIIRNNPCLKKNIQKTDIVRWDKALNLNNALIGKLLKQRDERYAHTDLNSEEIRNDIPIKEIEDLIALIQNIINEICIKLFQPKYDFILFQESSRDLENIINVLIECDNYLRDIEKKTK